MPQTQIPISITSGELACEGLFEIKGSLVTTPEIKIVVHVLNDSKSVDSHIKKKSKLWYIELHGGVPHAYTVIAHWFKCNSNDQHTAVVDDSGTILRYANGDMNAPERDILFDCGDAKSVNALAFQKKSIDDEPQTLALRDGQSLERIAKSLELINEKLLPSTSSEIREAHVAIDRLLVPGNVRQNRGVRRDCSADALPQEYKSRPE